MVKVVQLNAASTGDPHSLPLRPLPALTLPPPRRAYPPMKRKRLLFSVCSASMALGMTDYHLTPPTILPSLAVREAREKRRKVLDTAYRTRRANYRNFMEKKRRLQADGDLV